MIGYDVPTIIPPEQENITTGTYSVHLQVVTDSRWDSMWGVTASVGAGDKYTQTQRLVDWLNFIASDGIIPPLDVEYKRERPEVEDAE